MDKKKAFSEITPYLTISGGLLLVLALQANWEKISPFSAKPTATAQTVSAKKVKTVSSTTVHNKASDTIEGLGKEGKDGKLGRLTDAVDRLMGKDKEKQDTKTEKSIHWGYAAGHGPEDWSGLTPAYSGCKTGKLQSPIRLVSGQLQRGFQPLFYYKGTGGEIVNNGHSLQVNVNPGSFLQVLGKNYQLKQFHFHTQAEHFIDGRQYPMSVHLVHESDKGEVVVVAIMFEPEYQEYNMLVDRLPLPEQPGGHIKITKEAMSVDPATMLPPRNRREYFTYDGSLTTPPCSENVGWIVMKTPVPINMNRINRMLQIMKPNFRPTQPLNGRAVLYAR